MSVILLHYFVNKLPYDIIIKIQNLVLKPQPKDLLNDINSYYITKKIVEQLYIYTWEIGAGLSTIEAYNWLCNDLHLKFKNSLKLNLNMCWGMLTPRERIQFIKQHYTDQDILKVYRTLTYT